MITKPITMPNGAETAIHRVSRIEASDPFLTATVTVLSYPTEAAYLAGANPIWSTPLLMPVDPGVSIAGVESWLIASDSIFQGGSILPDASTSLDTAKMRKWAQIKQARAGAIDAPLATPYGVFDCVASVKTNITDAVLMMQTLAAMGQPITVDFTLFDNSVVTLTTTQMVTVGLLLGQKSQLAYNRARVLREQIDAATTLSELEAVSWEPAL